MSITIEKKYIIFSGSITLIILFFAVLSEIIDFEKAIYAFILIIILTLIYSYFVKEKALTTEGFIGYIGTILLLIGLLSGNGILNINLNGDRPDLDGAVRCDVIPANIIQEKNFSVNDKSIDYYADIYDLKSYDPVKDAQMIVEIPTDISPVTYKSFPENNANFLADERLVIAKWGELPSYESKSLVILYEKNEHNKEILISGSRSYTFTAYMNGNRKKDSINLNCDKNSLKSFS